MLGRLEGEHPIGKIGAVVDADEISAFLQVKNHIFVETSLRRYIVRLVSETRRHPDLDLGASPRGTVALFNAARVLAAIRGREFVIPEDIKYLAPYVLAHRVMVSAEASVRGVDGTAVIQEILSSLPVPTEEALHE